MGRIWACGSNGCGQLGLGDSEDRDEWTEIDFGGVVCPDVGIEMAGGGNHTLIVNGGNAYGAGSNVDHQLNSTALPRFNRFVEIASQPERAWKLCSAGWAFSVLVSANDEVVQIGGGTAEETAIKLPVKGKVKKIRSGPFHTVVLLESGSVVGWGATRHGQAGVLEPGVKKCDASVFQLPVPATDIACGRDFTAVLGQDGTVQVLGKWQYGDIQNELAPTRALRVWAGWTFLAIEHPQNTQAPGLTLVGNNSHGQLNDLGVELSSVDLGSEHGVGITVDNKVVTWGWGEHGNCPAPLENRNILKVFGGCATSFYVTS